MVDINKDKDMACLIDSSVLIHMFEGKNEGEAGELLKMMKEMKDTGKGLRVVTPLSSFLRAIFLADPNVNINNIQKTLSFMTVLPSKADFKDEKAVTNEVIQLAKLFSGGENDTNKKV